MIRPSLRQICRGQWAATSGSWVTMMIVRPWPLRSPRSPRISSPVRLSRLPVGSSARMMAGSVTRARAMATRWRCPPESWFGSCSMRSPRPTVPGRPGRLARVAPPGIEQRQLHVLQRVEPGQQVEGLEDEADAAVADLGQVPRRHARDVLAGQQVAPPVRAVQAAEDVHQGALARTRGAGDGDHLPFLDGQGNVVQGHDDVPPQFVPLHQLVRLDDRHG